jgi:hypothetical protein
MAKPTIIQVFGETAKVISDPLDPVMDTITAANPALIIPLSALTPIGLLNVAASMLDPEKVLTAIMNISTAWYRGDNTEDPLIEASDIRESTITRRNQKMRAYAFEYTVHKPLPSSPTIDPDTIDVL